MNAGLACNQGTVGSALTQSRVLHIITQAPREQVILGSIAQDQSYVRLFVGSLKCLLTRKSSKEFFTEVVPAWGRQVWPHATPSQRLSQVVGLRKSLSSDDQASVAFMWFFELAFFFFLIGCNTIKQNWPKLWFCGYLIWFAYASSPKIVWEVTPYC